MSDAPPVLHRGVGAATKCRSCEAAIVFATMPSSGKKMPFVLDPAGRWTLENGVARYIGEPAKQLELGAAAIADRYTSHFANCKDAAKWRGRGRDDA